MPRARACLQGALPRSRCPAACDTQLSPPQLDWVRPSSCAAACAHVRQAAVVSETLRHTRCPGRYRP
eukprot:13640312-Alexandrium_andersonii.AAC.1